MCDRETKSRPQKDIWNDEVAMPNAPMEETGLWNMVCWNDGNSTPPSTYDPVCESVSPQVSQDIPAVGKSGQLRDDGLPFVNSVCNLSISSLAKATYL